MKKFITICLLLFSTTIWSKPIQIVAAENFYGAIAKEIGGSYVRVDSIIHNPNQDPHLFSASITNAKAINNADIVIYNGIGYDDWMLKLLSASDSNGKLKKIINVADLMNKKLGDNPHIWYAPETMPTYAAYLTKQLIALDPKHADDFNRQLHIFNQTYQPLNKLIEKMHSKDNHEPVVATEPIFGYMANALGLKMYDQAFQISVMNNTEPSVANTLDIENRLKQHKVEVLIYNNQVVDPFTEQVKAVAKKAGIPIIGVSETQPANKTYVAWMTEELKKLQSALKQPK